MSEGRNVTCTITVAEIDGVLSIVAQIPDGFDDTIGVAITKAMMHGGQTMMNKATGQNREIKLATTN